MRQKISARVAPNKKTAASHPRIILRFAAREQFGGNFRRNIKRR